MKMHRTKAIVLRRTNYGEADRVVQLLTPTGKTSVMARGVRRAKSKLAGGIELFAICDVVIGEGKGDLGVLTSSRLIQFYGNILKDYDRMQFGYVAIKLIASASEMVDEPDWYDILAEVLAGLDVHSVPIGLVETWFYLRYAALMGHELSLYSDIDGKKLLAEQKYRYDVSEQGLRPAENGDLLSEHIKLMRLIATKPLKTLLQVGGTESILPLCALVARQHAAV